MLTRRGFLLASSSFLAACATRGEINAMNPNASTNIVDVLVATNRKRVADESIFSGERSERLNFAQMGVSIPQNHRPGELEIARRRADPRRHFGVTSVIDLVDSQAFSAQIARRSLAMPPAEREAVVYVHGFNTRFAEALYRLGQMYHDFRATGIPVLFSWPSSGNADDYLYDRDSVLFARDELERLLDRLENSQVSRIQLIGHSMGSQLIVETLRQRSIRRNGELWSKLNGVILISPDIDIDVFKRQAEEIGQLPQPFVIMTSNHDRALQLSEWISASRTRLGSVSDGSLLAALQVTVIDTTDESSRLGLNHMTGATSPAMISMLSGLRNNQITESRLPPAFGTAIPIFNFDNGVAQ